MSAIILTFIVLTIIVTDSTWVCHSEKLSLENTYIQLRGNPVYSSAPVVCFDSVPVIVLTAY